MSVALWQQCVELLKEELPARQFNTWIRPLQVEPSNPQAVNCAFTHRTALCSTGSMKNTQAACSN